MNFRHRRRPLRCYVSLLTGFVKSLFPCAACSPTAIGGPFQALLEASPCEHRQDQVTVNTLPDDVLVEIFHFYVNCWPVRTNKWHTLVHVCQRWRHVMFASPNRLSLRLEYTGKRPMSEMLDVWPVLPMVISQPHTLWEVCWRNVAVALESEHHHRICGIDLFNIPTSHWGRLAPAMQKPFPELTFLRLSVAKNTATSLPDSFLGGSTPLLRHLTLDNCPFPGLPKQLLSANQLVVLHLLNIPRSGCISPQDLVTALSVMSRLGTLRLEFQSPLYPASRPPPPLTRSVLPVLTRLEFRGVHEYLEDILAQIEVPFLNNLDVTFFIDIDFVIPQLHQLISQTESFKTCDSATVYTSDRGIRFTTLGITNRLPELSIEISCKELDGQLASLAQICSSSFLLLSTFVQLHITDGDPSPHWKDDMETTQWLELLYPFTAVKDLVLSGRVAPHVCQALEEVTNVLPALQNVFLRDLSSMELVPNRIMTFVAARKLSGHPVAVHPRE
ncbi:hypothetical protein F5148DRAFT_1378905 [Russula earlei]|uniref:Uncharacterized protein n=1 Tax=Russula earlei TaxID=71964 RepID=A0ACC0TY54_9AGAM|nr:hypothetical protein F5148DRAFT_1378905 [Russula earlei]